MPDLSIIIVNYNVKEFVFNLINSLNKATKSFSSEIIIIDNDSKDGSVEAIRKNHPDINLIASKENLGFGKANNLGLKISKGKFICLINPDTIVQEDTFTKLFEFFESRNDVGMAGCKVLNPDGTLQLPCRRSFPGPWTSFTKVTGLSKLFPNSKLFAKYNLTYLDENKSYEVDAISGSFMMLRREVYENIGGFDPQFFMYGEDLDLCFRTQQAGYKVFYVHTTQIIHYKGESTKRSSIDETKVFYNAMHLFVRKHLSSSIIVEAILQFAIMARKFLAFLNLYKLVITALIIDYSIITSSVFFAERIYKPGNWSGFPAEVKPWVYFFPGIIQLVISALSGAYKKKTLSVLKIILSLFIGMIVLSASTFFLKQYAFSRVVVVITYAAVFMSFIFWRVFIKLFFKIGIISDPHRAKTVVVGTDEGALKLADKLKSNIHSIISVTGLISFNSADIGKRFNNFEVIGSLENIKKTIRDNKINNVIFSSDEISFNEIFKVVALCQEENVEFTVAGSEKNYLVGKSNVTMLENIPLLKVNYNISNLMFMFSKRLFDLFISIPLTIFTLPFVIYSFIKNGSDSNLMKFLRGLPLVLSGSKSFVGPKDNYDTPDLFLGKPGLTGLWFIENIDMSDKVEVEKLDLYYAKNQNTWLDLEILGRTIPKLFF
ncbi:MAG: glycosyltransferase [Melioribacteraceae bacterium]|nr:glycosyltransferase [Melioribacteraceae bacterium]